MMSRLMSEEKPYFSTVVAICTAFGNTKAVLSFVMAVTLENGMVSLRERERERDEVGRQRERVCVGEGGREEGKEGQKGERERKEMGDCDLHLDIKWWEKSDYFFNPDTNSNITLQGILYSPVDLCYGNTTSVRKKL